MIIKNNIKKAISKEKAIYLKNKKPTASARSDSYQHVFCEVIVSFLSNSMKHSILYNSMSYNDDIAELRHELYLIICETGCTKLTDIKQKIFRMYYLEGMVEEDIAAAIGSRQPTIHKHLNGNTIYVDGKIVNRYGGIINSLIKLLAKNDRVAEIFKEIKELEE